MADKKVKEVSEPVKKPTSRKKKVDVVEEKITKTKKIASEEKPTKKKIIDVEEKPVKKKKDDVEKKAIKTVAKEVKTAETEISVKENKVLLNKNIEQNGIVEKDTSVLSNENTLSNKTNVKNIKKARDSKLPYIIVGIAVIALAVMLYLVTKNMGIINPPISADSSVIATSANKEDVKIEAETEHKKTVKNTDEIRNELNIDFREPRNAKNIEYSIRGTDNNVACMTYVKSYIDEGGDEFDMDFVMKSSFSQEDNMAGVVYQWGTPIIMTVICDDASEVEVRSNVAIEDNTVMKAEWMDNSLYYTMTTSSLYTREEFLQEVNRVIIANHIEF